MKKAVKSISKPVELAAVVAVLMAGAATGTAQAQDWQRLTNGNDRDGSFRNGGHV